MWFSPSDEILPSQLPPPQMENRQSTPMSIRPPRPTNQVQITCQYILLIYILIFIPNDFTIFFSPNSKCSFRPTPSSNFGTKTRFKSIFRRGWMLRSGFLSHVSFFLPKVQIFWEVSWVINGPRKLVEGIVFGRLFTFSPPTRASQLLEQMAIDGRPKPMPSPLNYPA